jgi:N utilization substance protein A
MSHDDEKQAVEMFMRILKTSEAEALAIVTEGHISVEEVAYVPLDELFEIAGVEKARIAEIRGLAREHLQANSV